jgi:hypothetical protein
MCNKRSVESWERGGSRRLVRSSPVGTSGGGPSFPVSPWHTSPVFSSRGNPKYLRGRGQETPPRAQASRDERGGLTCKCTFAAVRAAPCGGPGAADAGLVLLLRENPVGLAPGLHGSMRSERGPTDEEEEARRGQLRPPPRGAAYLPPPPSPGV